VTYSNGEVGPSGLLPARGVLVRVFQLVYDLDQTGQQHQNWRLAGISVTDLNGGYSVGNAFPGYPTFVEVTSVFQQIGGHGSTLQIIADPAGINSALPEPKRPIYVYRVGMDGVPLGTKNVVDPDNSTPPLNPIPVLTGNSTMNISVGLTDPWAVTVPNWYVPGSVAHPTATSQQSPPSAFVPVGGAPLAILDNAYLLSYYFGDPTPSQVPGGVLDLHYYPGLPATAPRSGVVYDTRLTPLSYDGTRSHYFGTIAGGPAAANPSLPNDAWDQRVIFPILARNFLYGQAKTALFPTGTSSLPSLSPDLALVDGLCDALAANLIGSPNLTDTSMAAPYVTRDISVIPALPVITPAIPSPGIVSPANLAALAWNLTQAEGATLNPTVMPRLYNLINPTGVTVDNFAFQVDIASMLGQVGRLLEGKQSSEPIDLSLHFTNPVLIGELAPFGILWPFDATVPGALDWPPHVATDWNPNLVAPGPASVAAPIPFSMANAQQIPDPLTGVPAFPNCSQGEVAYAKLAIFTDVNYMLSIDPATIPAGAQIEVVVDGHISSQAYLFPAATPPVITLTGNPRDFNNPTRHFIRIRLLKPDAVIPPFTASLNLALVPPPTP